MFWGNLRRRLTAAVIFLGQARKKGISNTAKSSYYRAATMLICTIVEGLAYQLVKIKTDHIGNVIEEYTEHKQIHSIPKSIFGTKNEVLICEKVKKDLHITDNGAGFAKLNLFLKNEGIISVREYRALERVRIERNRFHLQGLGSSDTGYTKVRFINFSKPTDFLTKKLDQALT